jgi:hypothetical protein
MLIRETPTTDPSTLQAMTGRSHDAEIFIREDHTGSVVVGDDRLPPYPARVERRVRLLFSGGRHGPSAGGWLFYVGLWAPDDYRDEFLAWYKLEHLPILLEDAEWDGCRFVEEKVARGAQFHALHQLADKTALDSPARKHSRSTPWFKRLAGNDWFDGPFTRTLCRRAATSGPGQEVR